MSRTSQGPRRPGAGSGHRGLSWLEVEGSAGALWSAQQQVRILLPREEGPRPPMPPGESWELLPQLGTPHTDGFVKAAPPTEWSRGQSPSVHSGLPSALGHRPPTPTVPWCAGTAQVVQGGGWTGCRGVQGSLTLGPVTPLPLPLAPLAQPSLDHCCPGSPSHCRPQTDTE